jgi:hypothetical protein
MNADTVATVALAVVAVFAFVVSAASAAEAYRSRIDGVAQRVVVSRFRNDEEVLRINDDGSTISLAPETRLDLDTDALVPIAIKARALISNEGNVTAFVQITGGTLKPEWQWNSGEGSVVRSTRGPVTQGGWWLIPPRCSAEMAVRWTRSAGDWWDDLVSKDGVVKVSTMRFELRFRDATGNALDKCVCEFGKPIISFATGGRGVECVILPIVPPESKLQRVETVSELKRSYPFESLWYNPLSFFRRR